MAPQRRSDGSGGAQPAGVDVVVEALQAPFEAHGFRHRRAHVYTLALPGGVLGVVTLGYIASPGDPWVVTPRPDVGVYHPAVERIVAELGNRKPHPYAPPTIIRSLGEMAQQGLFDTAWQCGPGRIAEPTATVVAALVEYGLPFLRSHTELPALLAAMRQGWCREPEYRVPVVLALLGQGAAAQADLDRVAAALGTRADRAAQTWRQFATAFRGYDWPVSEVT